MKIRDRILAELAKPVDPEGIAHTESFDFWGEVIQGIYGNYASESDRLMIGAMEAVRDKQTFKFIEREGFAGEFVLYVLAGHGMLNYGSSPRGGWPDESIADLWQSLIDKCREHYQAAWGEALP